MRCHTPTLLLLLTFVAVTAGYEQSYAAEADGVARSSAVESIAPHRALYEIDMVSKRSGSQVVNVDGKMMYEWRSACDGWNTQHRFHLFYEYTDDPAVKITSDFSTFENEDGQSLSFSSRRKSNRILLDEYRGHATLDAEGDKGQVSYTVPDDLNHDLPAATLLPTQHTAQMIAAIREGRKFFSAIVFDGSDETGAVQVNSFIGKKAADAPKSENKDIQNALLNSPAHNVRLAFFPVNSDESTPEYEMDMVFQENGVIREMLIQYDDFSIRQTLVALKKVKDKCKIREFNE